MFVFAKVIHKTLLVPFFYGHGVELVVSYLSGMPRLTGTATIAVSIIDANDNAPVITYLPNYPLVVRATAQQGDRVFCFTAEEPDMSLHPSFTFNYLCNSPHCNDFALRQTGGYFYVIEKYICPFTEYV